MEHGRVQGDRPQKKKKSDKAFYFAIDENGQKVSIEKALEIRDKNRLLNRRVVFYCPACYKRNRKVRGIPNNYKPPYRPRFDRDPKDQHLDNCPYQNPTKYLIHVTQKLNIKLDQKNKAIQLSLMDYDGRGFYNLSFIERYSTCARNDHLEFMKLIKHLLQDYDIGYFHEDYKSFSVKAGGKKPEKLSKLFRQIDALKKSKERYLYKLSLVIGTVEKVEHLSPHYRITLKPAGSSSGTFFIYLHDLFYDYKALQSLIGYDLACFGYISETNGSYWIEVLSFHHQIAILNADISTEPFNMNFKQDLFEKQLYAPAQTYASVAYNSFYKSYYQSVLKEFDSIHQERLERNKKRIKEIQEILPDIRNTMQEAEKAIELTDTKINHLEKERKRFFRNLFRLSRLKQELAETTQTQFEQQKRFHDQKQKEQKLVEENSQLLDDVRTQEAKRRELEEKLRSETGFKENFYEQDFYEVPIDKDQSVLFQIHIDYEYLLFEVILCQVRKKKGYYIPVDSSYYSSKRKRRFKPYRSVTKVIDDIWSFIDSEVNRFKQKSKSSLS